MSINFLDPIYYDIDTINPEAPNKPLLKELYNRMNAQNERLWEFFTEMTESPDYKPMRAEAVKPRTLRKKKGKGKKRQYKLCKLTGRLVKKAQSIDNEESEEFEAGYKDFLANEFGDS
jgi:hypothetical protein